jgi:DNA-binding transcriptional regulator YhcF (GntR family)
MPDTTGSGEGKQAKLSVLRQSAAAVLQRCCISARLTYNAPTTLSADALAQADQLESGGHMHLKDEQIGRLAEKVLGDLERSGLLTAKQGRGALLAAVKSAIAADLKVEEALERDAEALLEKTLRAMGGEGIDRHKMLRMIKEKLAKERKIVL